jgi:plasmid stability protein
LTRVREIAILKVGKPTGQGPAQRSAMPMIINIKPEARAELTRRAAAHGIQIEAYAAALLEEAVHKGTSAKTLTKGQLNRTLQELAQFSHKIPLLPDEAFAREGLYQDHLRNSG